LLAKLLLFSCWSSGSRVLIAFVIFVFFIFLEQQKPTYLWFQNIWAFHYTPAANPIAINPCRYPGCCCWFVQEQFFTDLEKEFESWSKTKKDSGKPMSLWEELSAIGEEFVDYLEDSLGVKEGPGTTSSSKSGSSTPRGSSSSSRPKSAVDEYEELLSKLGMKPGEDGSSSSNSSSSSSGSSR
jgi:hypothetical protein